MDCESPGMTFDYLPRELLQGVFNIDDFPRVLVSDKWTCNSDGRQAIDEDDDMLSATARELVERNGIGDTADSVWRALSSEHQKLFPATSRSSEDVPLIEASATLPGAQLDPAAVVEEAIAGSSVLVFGQRRASLSGRRSRGRSAVPEQGVVIRF
jgi:hypothetical protein